MEDQAIIELYFAREERAIKETMLKYGAYCMQVARNILRSEEDAEECVTDTWMNAWNAIPPQRPQILKLFLAKITRNLSINRYKALRRVKRGGGEAEAVLDELAEVVADNTSVEDTVTAAELSSLIDTFVRELPERDGNVFIRRYFYTEAVTEIAKRYNLTQTNVSVILNRTRGKLQEYLQKAGYAV
ncbi:MAG: sigma-70 family RNA polymerase sigma factor [Lachnospiraceae bacterium]|nr:sigma-70 family RNA polymerase sigma factor [Lachnospiraceae bacterium]